MSYATGKVYHDPAKMRERGRLDGLMGLNNVDYLPCKCDKCRVNYLDGQAEALFLRSKHEHGKNGA